MESAIEASKISITEEMKSSYIDYSMSVIVGRALPDVRDGLKPAHRRVLYGMSELNLGPGASYKKSARIVGEVLGKYHPHGEGSVYDTIVRMAQDFSLRYPLIDGQGNFGSVDGDSAAAMRYTEARMTRVAAEMLRDIKENTTDFQENFDGSLEEPTVLPAAMPNLLVNGGDGIAVGMATKIPPHNLGEVVGAVIAYIDDPDIDTAGLMEHVPGPDFPTGGIIHGQAGILAAYHTGRGRVVMRARISEEELPGGRLALIISEIPYQVNKSTLVEKIAHLVRDKRIDEISDLRDESDRDGMRIVIELKRGAIAQVVENKLYKYSKCQHTFGVNLVALVDGRPEVLTLKQAIGHYVDHRHEVVTRRTQSKLRKAEKKSHILQGLTIALDHLDAVITMIRHSDTTEQAQECLMAGVYPSQLTAAQLGRLGLPALAPGLSDHGRESWLTQEQADAILALRLSRLTGLERKKIEADYQETQREIGRLKDILGNEALRMEIIKEELQTLSDKYSDRRRSEINAAGEEIIYEDLIRNERVVVTISHQGVIKRTPSALFRTQGRGGRGSRSGSLRTDDYLEHLFVAHNLDYLLIFTDHGKCYWLRVFRIPEGSRTARGRSIRNLIAIESDDRIRAVLSVSKEDFTNESFLNEHFILMATRQGRVKKTALKHFRRPFRQGVWAIKMLEDDEVIDALLTNGQKHVILASSAGYAIYFSEEDARSMGRWTTGAKGMSLGEGERVVGMVVTEADSTRELLTISARGFGKRSVLGDYRVTRRGAKGVKTINITDRTGPLVAIKGVEDSDELMIVTENGVLIRCAASAISTMGRWTQGVTLIRLGKDDAIADVTRVVMADDQEDEE
ncbi:MAG: DNA gyrase subunit A [Bacteroidota bacterium]|nr:DNA gyrase subunit A [Bacteroidota bacterium]MDE2833008.1 DNA gyrase subunit A [Bacteroidota bacterium]